jgi:hypothetical protein
LFKPNVQNNNNQKKDDPEKIKKYHALINSYFQENNHFGKWSFKSIFRKQIQLIVQQFFNIIVYYFDRYTEKMFHDRMKGQYILTIKSRDGKEPARKVTLEGFDFLGDWKRFHRYKYAFFIQSVNKAKDWFTFDEDKIFEILIQLLETKGWTIDEREKLSIKQTVRRLYNILYTNYDTID